MDIVDCIIDSINIFSDSPSENQNFDFPKFGREGDGTDLMSDAIHFLHFTKSNNLINFGFKENRYICFSKLSFKRFLSLYKPYGYHVSLLYKTLESNQNVIQSELDFMIPIIFYYDFLDKGNISKGINS